MNLSFAQIDDGFRFILGRAVRLGGHGDYETADTLITALVQSDEFRKSPRSWKNGLPWPLAQVFVIPELKLMYCPIGKNACTLLKQNMVRAARHDHADLILENVHLVTDRVNTGLQLSDHPMKQVQRWMQDPQMRALALIRDPADRLLSAYLEKLIYNRNVAANHRHTCSVLAHAQSVPAEAVDYGRGISFDSFVRAVVETKPEDNDPHWRPQHLYLAGLRYSDVFAFEALDKMLDAVQEIAGIKLSRKPVNQSGNDQRIEHKGAEMLLPKDIERLRQPNANSFLTTELRALITDYYAKDYALYAEACRTT